MAHPNTRTESRNRATSASTSSKTSFSKKGPASLRAVSRRAYAASDETGTVAATEGTLKNFFEVVSWMVGVGGGFGGAEAGASGSGASGSTMTHSSAIDRIRAHFTSPSAKRFASSSSRSLSIEPYLNPSSRASATSASALERRFVTTSRVVIFDDDSSFRDDFEANRRVASAFAASAAASAAAPSLYLAREDSLSARTAARASRSASSWRPSSVYA